MTDFENVPDKEAERIANIVRLTLDRLDKRYPGITPVRRGVHPKDHGCVTASFKVEESLAEELRVGVFAKPGQQFDALIRFSNADVNPAKPDSMSDNAGVVSHGSRGMAMKLLGVTGTALMPTKGPLTQDFLMINQPVFAFANVEDYEALSTVLLRDADNPKGFFDERIHIKDGAPDMTDPVTRRAAITGGIVKRIASAAKPPAFQPPPMSPLDNQYFSGAPFLFGDERVMKFSAKPGAPVSGSPTAAAVRADTNYLRTALRDRLAADGDGAKDIVFEFQVQVRDANSLAGKIDPEIENVCFEWDEKLFPFKTVATIAIPPQDIDTDERKALCEDLIFSPWNGLAEHRPLGGINRLRRAVYLASAQLRHAQPTPTSRRCPHIE